MINLDKLDPQFDLKDLTTEQLLQILKQHQNTIIKVLLILGSLVAVGGMFNDHRAKEQALRTQMSLAQQKLDAIKASDAANQDLVNFQSSLPKKINEFELISLISDFARSYHINIPSLAPAESSDKGAYDVIEVRFDATSDNFKDMMLFLRKIENSIYPIRIDSWSGNEGDNGEIAFSIVISAVLVHP